MSRRRFHWTRDRYRRAQSLARYFERHIYDLPSEPPLMLRRLWELWERHPQKADPLLTPFRNRRRTLERLDDGIPF
jgi:hypothetical protein